MERALALAPAAEVHAADLPAEVTKIYGNTTGARLSDHTLRGWSSRYARLVLDRCDGNKRQACEVLDITYNTLQSRLLHPADDATLASSTPEARLEQGLYEQAG